MGQKLRPMDKRGALFIDIEGFGALYGTEQSDSLWGLSDLMDGIITIGRESPRLGVPRIFAHQFGDGFVIVNDSSPSIGRLVSIAVALHQYVLVKAGHFCGSALERGGLSDVIGCYPKAVAESELKNRAVRLGDGLMTITPVTGTALIKTYKLLRNFHGAIVVLPVAFKADLEGGTRCLEEDGHIFVNWLDSATTTVSVARQILSIAGYLPADLRKLFDKAAARNACKPDWIERTKSYL